jgi:outer membrane immunogenic protein
MKTILLASMALAASMVSPVLAADMPVKAPPPAPPPVSTWTGCYIGGNVGGARVETSVSILGVDDFSRSKSGLAAGGQIGCDYQFASNWVVGIQGLADWTNLDATRPSARFANTLFQADLKGFGVLSARFGYAVSQAFLLYGKVGWGGYKTKLTAFNTVTGAAFEGEGRTRTGFDAGVGGEYMIAPNWSLWVEWDHIFADDRSVLFPNLAAGTLANVERDFDKVLVGVNWRFGGARSAF